MDLGNKIMNLRKKNGLSQETLAEKIGVTRQTISKWELGETSPDIKQAKELSKTFNISLDELTDNDVKRAFDKKLSNTEKLAGIVIKILKIFGILILVMILLIIIAFVAFASKRDSNRKIFGKYSITCTIDGQSYSYEIEYNKNFQAINAGGDAFIADHTDVENHIDDANQMKAHIEDYFNDHQGFCEIVNSN